MSAVRFIMIGGFLGAGKTTTIARLARHYQQQGRNVAIVTNDQASDLVDTQQLRADGWRVGEVAGACFCCNFHELTDTVQRLAGDERPDVVLAEPVGSCTDLVATVVQPLMRLYDRQFAVAPFGVLVKPSHGQRILSGQANAGFSPKAAYIFTKQLEEADFLVLNRIDQLAGDEADELQRLLETRQPETPVLRLSARTGQGFDQLAEMLEREGPFGRRILELDYDTYAEGEAELGWLNSSLRVVAPRPFSLDALLLDILHRLRAALADASAETAHLKAIGLADAAHAVANLVSSDAAVELSLASDCHASQAELVINARVAGPPELLERLVEQAIDESCARVGARAERNQTQSFRPGRPVPTYRFQG